MCTNFEEFTSKKVARQESATELCKQLDGRKVNKTKRGVSFKRDWKEAI